MGFNHSTRHGRNRRMASGDVAHRYIILKDAKADGALSGAFTSGAWRTRVLNTTVVDQTGQVVLSSNQFTLPAGTYYIYARAPGFFVNTHKCRIFNITDNTTLVEGTSVKSNDDSGASETSQESVACTVFTITAAKTFELQHQCQTSNASNGFGFTTSFSTAEEQFSIVTIIQIPKVL